MYPTFIEMAQKSQSECREWQKWKKQTDLSIPFATHYRECAMWASKLHTGQKEMQSKWQKLIQNSEGRNSKEFKKRRK